jgi:DNA modification methylase
LNSKRWIEIGLPSWFIRLFTERKDIVLDPFLGPGTTAVAAIKLDRHFIGAEREDSYYELAMKLVEQANLRLFD